MADLSREHGRLRIETATMPSGECAWCGTRSKRHYCSPLCGEALTCYFLTGPMAAPVEWKWWQWEQIDLEHRWVSEDGRFWSQCPRCGGYYGAPARFWKQCANCDLNAERSAAAGKRRALIKASPETELIRLELVAFRDGWICHLCRGRVTPRNWSMDHLVPLSKGGSHTYANVKLAHRSCNSSRGAKPLPGQG